MKALIAILFLATPFVTVFSQPVMILESDKSSYEYGDTIEIRVTVRNTSDSTYTYEGSSSCFTMLENFNKIVLDPVCTSDVWTFELSPDKYRTDIWRLDPAELGLPDLDGTQTIHFSAMNGKLRDSIQVEAPRYLGGLLLLAFKEDVTESEIEALRDSLNAEVHFASTNQQTWSIHGFSIDSLAQAYQDDRRLEFIEPYRPYPHNQWKVATHALLSLNPPEEFSLNQNYPNPFNPVTYIEYALAEAVPVRFDIYDVTGRRVATLVDEFMQPGKQQVRWDATDFSSGIYIYRLRAGGFVQSRPMMLIR